VTIGVGDLTEMPQRANNPAKLAAKDAAPRDLHDLVAEIQSEEIREAIAACKGNKKMAAAKLGISRSFLYKKLAELDRSQ
jgi:DNA-binding NtrC family response regulator